MRRLRPESAKVSVSKPKEIYEQVKALNAEELENFKQLMVDFPKSTIE